MTFCAPFIRIAALSFCLAGPVLAEPAFKVTVDTTKAPECAAFAEKSKALVEEWYPKINEILFDKGHPLPAREITLIFEPMKGVANTGKNVMRISAEWVTKKAPNDYGMVVHELTHVVQDYQGKGEGWLTEGIADYIRDRHFEPGVRHHKIDPDKSSYRQAYGTAATFLIWLEEHKDKDIVRRLNIASHDGKYSPALFAQYCGADLDTLWKEFAETYRPR
ncbi:MAG: basic secretory protein-like protein [Chthoniobacter sp.]|uniref:basic secretory protein-like protein n=1 Tax=Chthoniobacter sp. TaxID=2510640 RepID=UPI0032A4FD54